MWFDHTLAQQREIHELTTVQRQVNDARIFDDITHFRIHGLQQGRIFFNDRHFFCRWSRLQLKIDSDSAPQGEYKAGPIDEFESIGLHTNVILTDWKIDDRVFAV